MKIKVKCNLIYESTEKNSCIRAYNELVCGLINMGVKITGNINVTEIKGGKMNVNIISGQTGSGKSLALYDIARSELQKKNKVLFISFENRIDEVVKNIFLDNDKYQKLNENLSIIYFKQDVTEKEFIDEICVMKENEIILIDRLDICNFIDAKNIHRSLNKYDLNTKATVFATTSLGRII